MMKLLEIKLYLVIKGIIFLLVLTFILLKQNKFSSTKKTGTNCSGFDALDNSDIQKEIFRGPRNSLLLLCAMFTVKAGVRLKELSKLSSTNSEYAIRIPEIFDHKCHAVNEFFCCYFSNTFNFYFKKLSEVTVALLKIAPYDLNTLSCAGLQKFFLHILPVVDWSVESNRSVLNVILRRLDKTISKVAKKQSLRRRINWQSISIWLDGLYHTLVLYPYIAHLHPVKVIFYLLKLNFVQLNIHYVTLRVCKRSLFFVLFKLKSFFKEQNFNFKILIFKEKI